MSQNLDQFNRGVIKPVECLKEGWDLIKDQYWLIFGICAVGILIASAFAIVLMGPMMCGVYLCLFQRLRREPVKFENLFKGFDYFAQSIIATLIQMIPAVIIMVPAYLIVFLLMFSFGFSSATRGAGDNAAAVGLFIGMGIFVVVIFAMSVVLGVFFMFTYPLIVDRKMNGVDAVKTSIKAAWANFGGVLGLVLLNAVLGFAGVLLCYIGAFFVMPITFTAHAIAYRKVFPDLPQSFAVPPPPPASWAA
jgi:hypothetical protein